MKLVEIAELSFIRCSSRELQRLDSLSRAPVFSHFSDTLTGTLWCLIKKRILYRFVISRLGDNQVLPCSAKVHQWAVWEGEFGRKIENICSMNYETICVSTKYQIILPLQILNFKRLCSSISLSHSVLSSQSRIPDEKRKIYA